MGREGMVRGGWGLSGVVGGGRNLPAKKPLKFPLVTVFLSILFFLPLHCWGHYEKNPTVPPAWRMCPTGPGSGPGTHSDCCCSVLG